MKYLQAYNRVQKSIYCLSTILLKISRQVLNICKNGHLDCIYLIQIQEHFTDVTTLIAFHSPSALQRFQSHQNGVISTYGSRAIFSFFHVLHDEEDLISKITIQYVAKKVKKLCSGGPISDTIRIENVHPRLKEETNG